jgi:hypothetical protein
MIKKLEAPPSILKELSQNINDKFGYAARITYQDLDGDIIDIGDDEDLRCAIKDAEKSEKLILELEPKNLPKMNYNQLRQKIHLKNQKFSAGNKVVVKVAPSTIGKRFTVNLINSSKGDDVAFHVDIRAKSWDNAVVINEKINGKW